MVIIGLRDNSEGDPLQDRLVEYAARGEITDLEEIELSQPITERILYPLARKFGELALRFTPQNAIQQTTKKLELAGNPGGMDA
ncbi:MAG: hypothetical protein GWO41_11965, partial [candidate division Zixibacteria bacterium]|nr:hypothetical protein [candidate division Zixibacteria bacterium]